MVLLCDGDVTTGINGEALCSGAWSYAPSFDVTQLDPAYLAGMYSTGFVLVGSVWLIGWAAREILALIRR